MKGGDRNWPYVLAKATTAVNAYRNDVTGYTPYYLFYGQLYNPVEGRITVNENHAFDLEVARVLKNEAKQKRNSGYTYREIPASTEIIVRYENLKNSKSFKGVVLEDLGNSCTMVKLEGRHRPIKVHKSAIYIEKHNANFGKIFGAREDPGPPTESQDPNPTRRRTRSASEKKNKK